MGGYREVFVAAMNESPEVTALSRKLSRQTWALSLYAFPLHFIVLASGFSAFPEAAVFIGSTWILARLLVESAMHQASIIALGQRAFDDTADRTTRHSVLLAHQRTMEGQWTGETEFWPMAKKRVEEEYLELDGEPPPRLAWWKSFGLIAGNVVGRLFGDLITIGIAAAIAS